MSSYNITDGATIQRKDLRVGEEGSMSQAPLKEHRILLQIRRVYRPPVLFILSAKEELLQTLDDPIHSGYFGVSV